MHSYDAPPPVVAGPLLHWRRTVLEVVMDWRRWNYDCMYDWTDCGLEWKTGGGHGLVTVVL